MNLKDIWIKICSFLGIPIIESCSSNEFPEKVSKLFDLAKQEILISTTLYPDAYNNKSVKESLERAIERNVDIEILLDKNSYNISEIRWLKEKMDEGKVKVFQSKDKIRHLVVVDGKHIREESPHNENNYNEVTNDIIINAGSIATFARDTLKSIIMESKQMKCKTDDRNSENV